MTPGRDLDVPERALAVGAHPDDIDFGCAATLAKWSDAGCTVSYLICTDGARGTWDPEADLGELVVRRQVEQRSAAQAVGATGEVVFLGWPDGELASGLRQRWQLVYWIRKLRPDVVLGHDPWKRYRLHPDHRHAGFLTVDAVATAREAHAFTEQDVPAHRPRAMLLFEADEVDHIEQVDDNHLARKLQALESHRSQYLSTMAIDESSPEHGSQLDAFRTEVRAEARRHGALAGCEWGEAFRLVTDV